MIRIVLCAFLCGLTVVVALATAAVQSGNRDKGIALDAMKRECDMLEAVNGDRCRRILAQDARPLPHENETPKPKDAAPLVVARGSSSRAGRSAP